MHRRPQPIIDIDINALEHALKQRVDGEVRFDTASRALYTTDASNYRQVPIGVVLPRTTDAVVQAVRVCHDYGAPIVSRGGGTGLCGQTCNVAVVIDHSKYLHAILDMDPTRKTARLQPGVILDTLRNTAEKKYGLTFGPDPATHSRCTLGGMIGNNSCGVHSVMASRTADNVVNLDILTYDGLRFTAGPTSDAEFERIVAAGGRRADIYLRLRNLRDHYASHIRKRFPKIPRRVSGYGLEELLPENGFNVARALVGSEGTLVTILEATLNLVWSPPGRTLLVLGYPDVFSAGDHISEIMGFGPIGCEGMDDLLTKFMKHKGLRVEDLQLLPPGNGWLITEWGGKTKQESEDKARFVMEQLKKTKNPPSMRLYTDSKEEEEIWKVRESGLGATANVPGMPLSWPGWEDAAVPPNQVGNYLREFRGLLDAFGYVASLYGHFGQGCIHCRISFDLFTHEGVQNYMKFIDMASDLVVKYSGSFSAEHGDGQSKAIFLPKLFGKELMNAFHEFKSIWDPQGKMNPGKIIDPYLPDQNLRFGADYRPWQPVTEYKFPKDDGSFSRATLRCVGVGKCREPEHAFMCPSFLATREEMHTTRGRAHMLFEMFKGDIVKDGWKSREVLEALELCLGCKGCKTDCPVNVDMAAYKAEFLSHYYSNTLRPRTHYAMGLLSYWGPWAAKVPWLANLLTQAPGLKSIAKLTAGFHRKREIPRFASGTFTQWFRRNRLLPPKTNEKVVFIPDLYNDLFFPDTLKSAVLMLNRWGFDIIVPDPLPREIQPLLHFGMLDRVKHELARAIEILREYASAGTPMLFLEPSTVSVYRDDMNELIPNDRDAQRIAKQCYLMTEFIQERKLPLPRLEGKAIFHGHCHQKAVLNVQAARDVLTRMGLEYQEPQPGCCGMAGSFGLQSNHYDVSMAIANQDLVPAVRQADSTTYILVEGFSCRSQILEATGRYPLHVAELLDKAWRVGGFEAMQPEAEHEKRKAA